MSFIRFVYWSAVGGGWAALLAWMALERILVGLDSLGETVGEMRFWKVVSVTVTAAFLGAAIGAALAVVAGMSHGQWRRQLRSALPGLLGGGAGGALGGLAGGLLHTCLRLPQFFGWTVMGLAIGAAQGLAEGSARKTRNGLIGGAGGGLVGGILFEFLARPDADAASRALGFVVLGASVGAMIGLVQVVLKNAWITVVDGFRSGRQLILAAPATMLGRGDHLELPLLGHSGRDLEAEHARLTRQADGRYTIEDLQSRIGTRVNGQVISGPTVLADGDLIRLGPNILRFNQRERAERAVSIQVMDAPASGAGGEIPRPPPPPGTGGPRAVAPLPASKPPPPAAGARIPPPPPPR